MILEGLLGSVVKSLADSAIGKISDAFIAYQNKQISQSELEAKVKQTIITSFADIEKAAYDAMAKTFDSFMKAVSKNKLMQVVWGAATISQLFVLLWHQVGIPFVVFMGWTTRYPSSGTTVEWSYLLLAGLMGLGPVMIRSGPGAGSMLEQLKTLAKK